jgi:hypothetical protein
MPVLSVASPEWGRRGRPPAPVELLSDADVKGELVTVALADSLEANGNLPPERAAAMRDPALARLYPGG